MEQSSFYGGRKGTSFVIVKNYPDIPTMVAAFKQGIAYTIVNFDQYVLINTVNKNHPDNGKIFRRGYDYNTGSRTISAYRAYVATEDEEGHPIADKTKEIIDGKYLDSTSGTWIDADYHSAVYEYTDAYDAGGAIYIGTIAGPAGRAPHLHMATYEQVRDTHAGESFEEYETHGSYTLDNGDLLPGKYVNGGIASYNDDIQWYCVSIRDNNNEDAEAYIGLKIPYPVIDFTAEAVATYDQTGAYGDTTAITRIDDQTHPFYEKWNISIPKGIQGDSLKNFRVFIPEEDFDEETSETVIYRLDTQEPYPYEQGKQILVYDYYHYDNLATGEPVTYYIGDYNLISSLDIADNGDIQIIFTHGDNIILPKAIKRIERASFEENELSNACILTLEYNTTDEEGNHEIESFPLDWVKGLTVDNDGSVHISYTMDEENRENGVETINHLIKWINDVTIATEGNNEGAFVMSFNNEAPAFTANLHWVNDIDVTSVGNIVCSYSQGDLTGNEQKAAKTLASRVRWINNISVNDYGTLTVTYNTINQQNLPETQVFDQKLKWIDDISMDKYGVITTTYNTLSNVQQGIHNTKVFDNPVRWINSINLTSDGILSVTYNTKTGQTVDTWTSPNKIKYLNGVDLSNDGYITLTYNTKDTQGNPETETFLNQLKWIDDATIVDGDFAIKYNTAEDYTTLATLKYVTDISLNQSGQVTLIYNTKTDNIQDSSLLSQRLKWITSVSFTNGQLLVNYNNGNSTVVANNINLINDININANTGRFTVNYANGSAISSYSTTLHYPNNVSVNTGVEGNQKIHITYTDNTDGVDIGEPINYIEKTKIVDNHLLVLYSDPAKRTGTNVYHNGEVIDGRSGWIDLGAIISDRAGVLVGANYTWAEVYAPNEVPDPIDYEDAIDFLNREHPDSFSGGKIITVGNPDGDKYFFGFDYNYVDSTASELEYKGWYWIGLLTPSEATISSFLEDADAQSISPSYPLGTLWFVEEDVYNISYTLTNVTCSNKYSKVREGYNYTNTLTPATGTILSSVVVIMGETTIYNSAQDESFDPTSHQISISSITGDVTITASAVTNNE